MSDELDNFNDSNVETIVYGDRPICMIVKPAADPKETLFYTPPEL